MSIDERTFTDIDNAIDNLEMVAHFLTSLESQWKWKWVMIAAHQALYTFALCALAGTSAWHTVTNRGEEGRSRRQGQKKAQAYALRVEGYTTEDIAQELGVKPEKVKKWWEEEPHILSIGDALKRLENKDNLPWIDSQPLVMEWDEKKAVDSLVWHRNQFAHFFPNQRWVIDPVQMSDFIARVMPIVRFIALEANCITYIDPEDVEKIKEALQKIQTNLPQSQREGDRGY